MMTILLAILLQVYTIQTEFIRWGNNYYAKLSPKRASGNMVLKYGDVLMVHHDPKYKDWHLNNYSDQHFLTYGDSIFYILINADICEDGSCHYIGDDMWTNYINDKSTIENLTE